MLRDLFIASRTLLKQPGYAVTVILTLALGIGASAMMFSLVDAALLRPLPFRAPNELVMLSGVAGPQRAVRGASFPEVGDWRAMNATLQEVSIYDEIALNARIDVEPMRVDAEMVSASYFSLLGVSAARGRTFLPEEDATPDRYPVAVVSDRFWREQLGSDPQVLTRMLTLNDRSFQIVGVMPPDFAGLAFDTDVWVPSMMVSLTSSPTVMQNRSTRWLFAVGRLKDGVTLARAQEDLSRVAQLLEQQYPDTNRQRGVDVNRLRDALLSGADVQVKALFGGVLLFLAVACANATALQLVRAASRRRELAVRIAVGAHRWHVLRQLLIESLLLSLVAGIVGAISASWGTSAAVAFMPNGALPRHVHPVVDVRSVLFTIVTSIVVAVLVAIVPALAAARANVAEVILRSGRTLQTSLGAIRGFSSRQLLVIAEIALAMVLLTLAGLLVRSLDRERRVPLGFEPARVTMAQVTLPASRYNQAQRVAFVHRLENELRSSTGVQFVAIASDLPLIGEASASRLLPDVAPRPDADLRYYRHRVTPGFFATLHIPIVSGRAFTWQDNRDAPIVAIVSAAAARRIWGNEDAVGHHFSLGSDGPPVEIVGVAGTARFRDLTTDLTAASSEPDVYFSYGQFPDADLSIAVRSASDVVVPGGALRAALGRVDGTLPLFRVQRLDELVRRQTSTERFVSALLTMFSAGAMLLAAIGLYGFMAYMVSLSRREIAIRLALGADRTRVVGLIVRNGMTVVLIGILIGTAGALVAGRAIQAQLFQTRPGDPTTFLTVAGLLSLVAFIATLLPTRRATAVDPHTALKAD
jgi:putative ABC transport system permease protein